MATIASLLILAVVAGLLRRMIGRYVQDSQRRYRIRKFLTLLSYLVGIIVVAFIFSDRLRSLTVVFGVAGAGIAFALQEVIMSIAGWLAISFGGYYKVGDRIKLAGIRGDVIDIGILRTILMECGDWVDGDLYNGRIVRISNRFVFKEPVYNYSADFPFLWDEIMVPIKYGSDYQLAKKLILEIGKEVVGEYAEKYATAWGQIVRRYLIEPQRLEPTVTVEANENWIKFTLRYIVDYKERRAQRDILFWKILVAVDQTQDRVGIAASTLNIEKLVVSQIPPVHVRIVEKKEGTTLNE